jgi:ATP-binding protein involved in chromosome partitioning
MSSPWPAARGAKTTVAVNLALALHLDGVRVGLFDADLHGPNIPLMLGIQPKPSAGRPLNIPVVRTDRKPYIPPLERFGLQAMSLGLLGDTDTSIADGPLAGRMIRRADQVPAVQPLAQAAYFTRSPDGLV